MGGRVVEEHVGKKRRKEVRQAIALKKEMNRSLLFILIAIVVGGILVTVLTVLTTSGVIQIDNVVTQAIPLAVLALVFVFIGPRCSKWRDIHDQYKLHLKRYNISKDDMNALERGDL